MGPVAFCFIPVVVIRTSNADQARNTFQEDYIIEPPYFDAYWRITESHLACSAVSLTGSHGCSELGPIHHTAALGLLGFLEAVEEAAQVVATLLGQAVLYFPQFP